ncbi:hypothetical protein BD289DRAFT_422259 [Coniella lustricola]|uniref:Uncharacterized protein n=1 Tax=Coniella lustricola TaxID=2025994 RepID=A0A2T3AKZ0_9PEZI|nr:hypothetical protein BD289DRAFT_422259 [Coniella lustricola]
MRAEFALIMIAGLTGLASATSLYFTEYSDTACSTEGYNHDAAELMDGGDASTTCVGLEDDTVAIKGYWSVNAGGYLYAYTDTDCSGTLLDSIPLKSCFAVNDFMGWGEDVKAIQFVTRAP